MGTSSNPGPTDPSRRKDARPRAGWSPFSRFALTRGLLIPAQLVFVLLVAYLSIQVPSDLTRYGSPPLTVTTFLTGFWGMVANIFTGHWGIASGTLTYDGYSWFQLYRDFLPNSLQIALFALPIAAALAYVIGLSSGWTKRPEYDTPSRITTLGLGLVPAFLIGLLVEFALFFVFYHVFHDIPGDGIIPSPSWYPDGIFPPWITGGWITHPTGLPMIDGIIHEDWPFEAITLAKTLMQAIVVALVYVAIFMRHARNVVASTSQEASITAARSRGISEHTLLWRHTAAQVRPTFLLLFALTVPAYLATQFVVESVFVDPGVGYLTLTVLTAPKGSENLAGIEGMVFVLAVVVLVWTLAVDLLAARSDPRGVTSR